MAQPRDRWFWFDVVGFVASLVLLTWLLWSSLDDGGRGTPFAALPAIIFAVRLARRAKGAN